MEKCKNCGIVKCDDHLPTITLTPKDPKGMKILTVTTTRKFDTEKEWRDYREWFKSIAPHQPIDLDTLEADGEATITTHHPGEDVISVYSFTVVYPRSNRIIMKRSPIQI